MTTKAIEKRLATLEQVRQSETEKVTKILIMNGTSGKVGAVIHVGGEPGRTPEDLSDIITP